MTYYYCTYFDSNYLYKGLTMYRSLRRVSSDFKLWILCFDDLTYNVLTKMRLEDVELIKLKDFEDEDLLRVKKERSPVEYFWTCTPSLLIYILHRHPELDIITYIDADIFFYSDPMPIFKEFKHSSILLIEHRFAPKNKNKLKKFGLYNVQFITFRNDSTGNNALYWWRGRCIEWCYRRAEDGRFGDQKYLDDWTDRFRNVCVLQHKGAGLAPWNILQYQLTQVGHKLFVDEYELIFYHFHFFHMLSRRVFNLSVDRLSQSSKQLLYIPYLNGIKKSIDDVKDIEPAFNRGYTAIESLSIMDVFWTVKSFIRGNFMWSHK